MSALCFLSQYSSAPCTCGGGLSGGRGRLFSSKARRIRANKKGGASQSGYPSPMSLSEEGSLVSCIGVPTGNRSTFFKGKLSKKKRTDRAHTSPKSSRENPSPQTWL